MTLLPRYTRSSPPVVDLKRIIFGRKIYPAEPYCHSFYTCEFMEKEGGFPPSPPFPPPDPRKQERARYR